MRSALAVLSHSFVQLAEPHQHHRKLGSCGGALWVQPPAGGALNDAGAAGPLHGRDRVFTQVREVRVTEDVGILTDRHIISLQLSWRN